MRPRSALYAAVCRLVEERATPEPNTGCLLWTGALEGKNAHRGEGYAVAQINGKKVKIIRVLLGLTDPRVFACHTCDVPACVNEQHLYAGSAKSNMQDSVRRGRHASTRKTHCSKDHPFDGIRHDHGKPTRYCTICERAKQAAAREADRENYNARKRHWYAANRKAVLARLKEKRDAAA